MEGGIDDVGLGVLFVLELYKYEFAGLLMHAEHLEAVHGVGPHTISVPRLKRADDIDPDHFDNGIDDDTFAKITACIRLAVPYTGIIISTRENEAVRTKLLRLGVSQVSGGSRTSVGGYAGYSNEDRPHDTEQFDVSDQRSPGSYTLPRHRALRRLHAQPSGNAASREDGSERRRTHRELRDRHCRHERHTQTQSGAV